AAAGPAPPALDTTVTVGSTTYAASGTSSLWFAYGYALGVDYLAIANMGSIGSATYTDGGSNSRTVSAIYWTDDSPAPGSDEDNLHFCLNAQSISNTDTTFVSIDYNGTNYLRSAATYTATTGSCSTWRWININPNGPTGGTVAFKVNI
ncbi:MAG: hypothetical protein ACQ9ET_03625, partial [Nitrosomonadaceae bacterium]